MKQQPNYSVAFIGAGNMAGAIIRGLLAQGFDPSRLIATTQSAESAERIRSQLGINVAASNAEACRHAEVIVLAVKPQSMRAVCAEIRAELQAGCLVISVAAGLRLETLQAWLETDTKPQIALVRSMPNTPSAIGRGATGLFYSSAVNADQRAVAETILSAVGVTCTVDDEALLDVVTALSGSGPAYFFYFIELMQQTAEAMGLDTQSAETLALQTALGAAELAHEHKNVPRLRAQVTSPKGTTEQALKVFQSQGLPDLVKNAMQACAERAQQLAYELGKVS